MYQSPRRPYYNRHENMPQSAQNDDSATIETKRFWQLLKNLRRRQQDVKQDNKQKPAKSG